MKKRDPWDYELGKPFRVVIRSDKNLDSIITRQPPYDPVTKPFQ